MARWAAGFVANDNLGLRPWRLRASGGSDGAAIVTEVVVSLGRRQLPPRFAVAAANVDHGANAFDIDLATPGKTSVRVEQHLIGAFRRLARGACHVRGED